MDMTMVAIMEQEAVAHAMEAVFVAYGAPMGERMLIALFALLNRAKESFYVFLFLMG